MSGKTDSKRDAFGFGLGALRTAAAYTTTMAVADDGINAAWDERLKLAQENPREMVVNSGPAYGRFWLFRSLRAKSTKEQPSEGG